VLSRGAVTGLDNVVAVTGQHVRVRCPPEDLVFFET